MDDEIVCKICNKNFDYVSSLVKHMRIHTGEKPYKCKTCEMSFSQVSNLIRHERIHNGYKPFSCEICEKSFTSSSNLQQHMNTHKNETKRNVYQCFIKDCDKHYFYVCTLKKHMFTHHGEQMTEIQEKTDYSNFHDIMNNIYKENFDFIDYDKTKPGIIKEDSNSLKDSFRESFSQSTTAPIVHNIIEAPPTTPIMINQLIDTIKNFKDIFMSNAIIANPATMQPLHQPIPANNILNYNNFIKQPEEKPKHTGCCSKGGEKKEKKQCCKSKSSKEKETIPKPTPIVPVAPVVINFPQHNFFNYVYNMNAPINDFNYYNLNNQYNQSMINFPNEMVVKPEATKEEQTVDYTKTTSANEESIIKKFQKTNKVPRIIPNPDIIKKAQICINDIGSLTPNVIKPPQIEEAKNYKPHNRIKGHLSDECRQKCGSYLYCPAMIPSASQCNKYANQQCDCVDVCKELEDLYISYNRKECGHGDGDIKY